MGDALSLAQFAGRVGLNLTALVAIGFALHAASGVVERNALERWRWPTALAAVAAILFSAGRLPILTAQMGDGTTFLDPDLSALGWIALGPSTLALTGGAVAILAGVLTRSRLLLAAGAAITAAGFALTGHTQGLPEPGLAPFAVAIHVLIAGFWVVGPFTLFPAAGLPDSVLVKRLHRFSMIAVVAIPILIVFGLWLAWILAGGIEALFGSAYGRLLLLKLGAGSAAMAIGAFNKQLVTPRVIHDPAKGRHWLRLTLLAEAALFLTAILVVAAATTLAGPGE